MDIDRDGSPIAHWRTTPAPKEAIQYYKLNNNATLRDMILMIRADEICHIEVHHFMGEVNKSFDLDAEKGRMYKDSGDGFIK